MAARRRVREAQARVNEARAQRERENLEDAARVVVCLGKVVEIDAWEAERLALLHHQVHADAERKRAELRSDGGAAAARLQQRGETLTTIADLTDTGIAEIRALLRCAPTIDSRPSLGSLGEAEKTTASCDNDQTPSDLGSLNAFAVAEISAEPAKPVAPEGKQVAD